MSTTKTALTLEGRMVIVPELETETTFPVCQARLYISLNLNRMCLRMQPEAVFRHFCFFCFLEIRLQKMKYQLLSPLALFHSSKSVRATHSKRDRCGRGGSCEEFLLLREICVICSPPSLVVHQHSKCLHTVVSNMLPCPLGLGPCRT
jgi:hypothetical protein